MEHLSIRNTTIALLLSLAFHISDALAMDYANPELLTSVEALEGMIASKPAEKSIVPRIIDVRMPKDYREGHIPGAINIPYTDLTDPHAAVAGALKSDAALADLLGRNGIGQKSEIVLYDDQGGFRAARLFWLLEYYGHRKVSMLNGGIQSWTGSGLKLARSDGSLSANVSQAGGESEVTVFSITQSPRRFASADTILNHRGDKNTVVVDVRPAKMFAKGHIPWAKNVPWKQNLAANGMLKSADDLMAHFAAKGIAPGNHVIIHCQTGEASAHTYFTLRVLGFPRVRTYHRSWAEWGSDPSLPST